MQRRIRPSILLIVLLLFFGNSAHAQDSSGSHDIELPDGTLITIPSTWEFDAEQAEEETIYIFSQTAQPDINYLIVYPPERTLTFYENLDAPPTPTELLELLYAYGVFDYELDADQLAALPGGMTLSFMDDDRHSVVAVIEIDTGLLYYEIRATPDDYDAVFEVASAILTQITEPETSQTVAVPCTARAASSDATLRVGPGFNRGEYRTLLPNEGNIRVTGQTNDPDDNLWWQLEETVPNADPLWVVDSDVTTTGDCDQVELVAAPAIIPPAAPPTPATTSAAGSEDLPRNGTWNRTITSQLALSCTDPAVQDSLAELGVNDALAVELDNLAGPTQVTVSPDGGALNLGSDLNLNRVNTGVYQIVIVLDADTSMTVTVTASSAELMLASIQIDLTALQCTAMATITFQFSG
jgi:hypothetical protein